MSDSEAFFQYSVERGVLMLRWQEQKAAVGGEVRLSRLSWRKDGPRADARPLEAGTTLVDGRDGKQAAAVMVPAIEFASGGEIVLGFADPSGEAERGFMVLQVPEARLRALQAQLLHEDARRLLERSAGDLLASARAAGLLDAALQLAPGRDEARLDYARLLARQGEAAAAVRELEHLKAAKELRSKIDADKAFDPVRAKEPFKKFCEGLSR